MNKNTCLSEQPDKCVLYTGKDMPFFQIKNGEYYDTLVVKLANVIQEYVESTVELECLYKGTCDACSPTQRIPEALQVVIDFLCGLNSDGISFSGDLSPLMTGGSGSKLTKKHINYNVSSSGGKSSLSFDMTNIADDLPQGYTLANSNVKITGKPKAGRSILVDSNKTVAQLSVDYDRYPLKIETNVRYNTPNGTVDLVDLSVIDSPTDNEIIRNFKVQDFTSNSYTNLTQAFNIVIKQVKSLLYALDELRNLDVSGCENIKFNTTDIRQIVGVLASTGCDHESRLAKLETATVKDCSGDCGERVTDMSNSEALAYLSTECCTLREDNKNIQKKLMELENKLAQMNSK